jgi:hypothetical protein
MEFSYLQLDGVDAEDLPTITAAPYSGAAAIGGQNEAGRFTVFFGFPTQELHPACVDRLRRKFLWGFAESDVEYIRTENEAILETNRKIIDRLPPILEASPEPSEYLAAMIGRYNYARGSVLKDDSEADSGASSASPATPGKLQTKAERTPSETAPKSAAAALVQTLGGTLAQIKDLDETEKMLVKEGAVLREDLRATAEEAMADLLDALIDE